MLFSTKKIEKIKQNAEKMIKESAEKKEENLNLLAKCEDDLKKIDETINSKSFENITYEEFIELKAKKDNLIQKKEALSFLIDNVQESPLVSREDYEKDLKDINDEMRANAVAYAKKLVEICNFLEETNKSFLDFVNGSNELITYLQKNIYKYKDCKNTKFFPNGICIQPTEDHRENDEYYFLATIATGLLYYKDYEMIKAQKLINEEN